MAREKLREYPSLGIGDSFLDFEETQRHFGTGSCNYAIGEKKLDSGEIVVYICQQREGFETAETLGCFGRVCEQGIIIQGYLVNPTGILKSLKSYKIRTIPFSERSKIALELTSMFGDKKPDYMEFGI